MIPSPLPTSIAEHDPGHEVTHHPRLHMAFNTGWVNAMDPDYGCLGDGTEEHLKLQDAADAAEGNVLQLPGDHTYRANVKVTINAGTTVVGKQALLYNDTVVADVLELSAGCTVEDLEIAGTGAGVYHDAGRLITFAGTVGSYVAGVRLVGVTLRDAAGYAVWSEFADDVWMERCKVLRVAYTGVSGASVKHFYLSMCEVDMDDPVGHDNAGTRGVSNAYGVAFSRNTPDAGNLTTQPRSTDCGMWGGFVTNVQCWQGVDTHAGQRIFFVNIIITNVNCAVALVPSNNSAHVSTYAPLDCYADVIASSDAAGTSGDNGVDIAGAFGVQYADNCIVRGSYRGFGDRTLSTTGALWASYTRNLQATIVASECTCNSIVLATENKAFSITFTSMDVWGVSRATHWFATGVNNSGVIFAQVMSRGGFSPPGGSVIDTEGGRCDNASGTDIRYYRGPCSATTPLVDVGLRVSIKTDVQWVFDASRGIVIGAIPITSDVGGQLLVGGILKSSTEIRAHTGGTAQARLVDGGGFPQWVIASHRMELEGAATFKTGLSATGSRPNAATVGNGAQYYDLTLHKPIWSDGTNWRDAAGSVV